VLGAVLDETWTLYTRFFVRFFVIALIVFAVVNVIYALLLEAIAGDSSTAAGLMGILALVATLVGGMWLTGALVHVVVDAREGTLATSVGDSFAKARPFIGTLLLASLLAGLGIIGGVILLIVPGIILAVRWSLIAPAVVLEGRRVKESLGRSNALVKGSSWVMLGLILIVGLIGGIAGMLLQAAFAAFPQFIEIALGQTIANAVVQPFSAIALTLMFLRLRETKDPTAAAIETADPAPGSEAEPDEPEVRPEAEPPASPAP
jgi:hypothetical protein